MLATNASGAHVLVHGYTRDHVESLRTIWADGNTSHVAKEPVQTTEPHADQRRHAIAKAVASLLDRNHELINSCRPRTPFNRCGYLLTDLLEAGSLNLAKLLVGSEGTLAFFTEATLRTIPLPAGRSIVLLGFESLDKAVRAAQRALTSRPAACELIDRRLMTLARGRGQELRPYIPVEAEAVLLIEYESDTVEGAREAARRTADRLRWTERLAISSITAFEEDEIERIWLLRENVLPSLYAFQSGPQPVPCVEDVGVPVDELLTFLHRVQEILKKHETTASFLIHAGSGQVHTRPFLDLQNPAEVARLWSLAEEIHGLALELGGTVSTQHGTGLARTPWVEKQYGPLFPVFRELKAIFDPHHLLNPGKIVGPDPGMPAWPLRRNPSTAAEPERLLRWQPGEVRTHALNCNGCGHCRTEDTQQRMCPTFRATVAEAASPRAKANLLRHLLQDGTDPRQLTSPEVRAVADLCVNCRMCATECPAHVNIPKLMLEAKAANVAEHGLDRTDWSMSRTETFAAMASLFAGIVNAGLSSKTVRWILETFFGVSRKRQLPRFAARNFLRRAARRGWTRKPIGQRKRVAYFVDIYANYNDPQIAESVVAVLQHNGIEVFVPPGQVGCGMAPLAYGDVEAAREAAEINLRVLAELAREGYPIICSEPTAALMLAHDYRDLLDNPDVHLVSDKVVEFTSFLWDLHTRGELRTDFRPLDLALGHHIPCHLKALGRPPAGPLLLSLIPELRVHTIDVSCSGMAGTFGLKAKNYDVSLEAGRPMLQELRRPKSMYGSTECSTCRMQMEHGGRKRTLHPAQYLALAYGLMPEIADRLNEPISKRVLQ